MAVSSTTMRMPREALLEDSLAVSRITSASYHHMEGGGGIGGGSGLSLSRSAELAAEGHKRRMTSQNTRGRRREEYEFPGVEDKPVPIPGPSSSSVSLAAGMGMGQGHPHASSSSSRSRASATAPPPSDNTRHHERPSSSTSSSSSSAVHHHHRSGGHSSKSSSDYLLTATQPTMNTRDREKYIENFDYPFCDDVGKYEKLTKIGQGTFGEVFRAKHRKTKKIVALKKVLMENEKEGFPITALREIKILQLLKHENVVNLLEICRTKAVGHNNYRSTFYLVFDFCDHDLAGLLSNVNVKFSLGEIKKVIQQLLNGLYYIHTNKILHRDMKAANVLLTRQGILKLADFGLARAFSVSKNQPNRYTNRVVTLWYRPPELLLGERNYGPAVDMWGAGCIMAEMWTRAPIMQGSTEQQQITYICQLCGSITPEVWPAVESLDLYQKLELPKNQKRKVKERLKFYVKDPYACDLLDKLLTLDPAKRVDADTALNHDFFWTDPMPSDLGVMLQHHTTNMFEYLAPPRKVTVGPRGSHVGAQPQLSQQPRAANDAGFRDRVF